jgi:hypothetical protein
MAGSFPHPESAKKEKKRSGCTQLGRAWQMFVAAGERFDGARQLTWISAHV